MSKSLANSQILKIILNPQELGFIPNKFWSEQEISISDIINILTNHDAQINKQPLKFNHKLWCILQITSIYADSYNIFGAKWKNDAELIIEIESSIFSKFYEKQPQDSIIHLFETNGWQSIVNNDTKTHLFTISEKSCLNNELFDIDFYEKLAKFHETIIQKLSELFSKSLLLLAQNKIDKSINYMSKKSEMITLNNNFNDDLILSDVVHFVTFPGEIKFDQSEQNKENMKKIFEKIEKEQLMFDESSFDNKYHGINVILELPPFVSFSFLPKVKEFLQSISVINSMVLFSDEFKKLFFEKVVELIQKVEYENYFFEFISIAFVLIKSHQFDLKSFNPIFMSPLFDDNATVYNYYSEDYQKIIFLREKWINLSFGINENMMSILPRKFSHFKNIFQSLRTHPIGFSEFTLIVSRDFCKYSAEYQNYIMLLMAQTNVYYFDCLRSILFNDFGENKNNEILLNKHFSYQQMMNVRKLYNFDCRAQFEDNFGQLNQDDQRKVNAIIQARFSILTFFYKNFNEIFKCDKDQPLNAYQFKTFKLVLSFSFEISLQKQILALIDSNNVFYIRMNDDKDVSFFEHFCQIYFKMFNKKANDIITIIFCDNLIKFLHNKIYKILSKGVGEDSNEKFWIDFLLEIFPNIIYWYSLIDINFIPIDIVQLSICNTISFMTTCLYFSNIPPNEFLHELFEKVFNSLYNELENICLLYFVNYESYRDLIFKNLLNLAAEKELNSFYSHFAIRYGKAIKIFLKIFFSETILSYLNDICFMDIRNCYQLTENKVDILLVDYLYNNRNNKSDESRNLIISVLKLAKTLAYQHSSLEFIQKFISLFTPINGSQLPFYLPLFVSTLDDLSMKETILPTISIPLLKDKCNLNVFSVNPEIVNDGITFSFWLFFNKTILEPRKILTIRQKIESIERKIIFSLNPNRKFSFTVVDEDTLIGQTKKAIPEGKWQYIMASVCFRKKEVKLAIKFDDSILYKDRDDDGINKVLKSFEGDSNFIASTNPTNNDYYQFFEFKKFDVNSKIQIFIGEEDNSTDVLTAENNNSLLFSQTQSNTLISSYEKNILLGPIALFPLLKDNTEYLFYMFNSIDKIPSKSLFYAYPFKLSKGIVTLKLESNQFNSISFPIEFEFTYPFINVFISSNLADKLIPLFGFNDLRKKSNTIKINTSEKSFIFEEADENYYFDYTNAAIEILNKIFTISEESQILIYKNNGFHHIVHFLTSTMNDTIQANEKIEKKIHSLSLDCYLYKNFVSLFESLTIQKVQQQFLNDILFNFELWIKSKDFDLILNHWYTSLIPDFSTYFFNKYSIVSLLTLMRLYLYLQPIEKSIISQDRNMTIEKIKFCRKIFWSIISSSDNFSQVDLTSIISNATTCPDFQHVEEIIDFLSDFLITKLQQREEIQIEEKPKVVPAKQKFLKIFGVKNQETNNNAPKLKNNNNNNNFDIQDFNSLLQLTLLVSSTNLIIVKKVIILFIKLYQMQPLNVISFESYFELICMNLSKFDDPDQFLDELLTYFCPQILSLCIIVALQANSDESLIKVIKLMETFEQPENFCVSKSWFLWPVISCFIRPRCHERMIDFFVKCPQTEWTNIYNSILIVGNILNVDTRIYLHYFLARISSSICTSYDDSKTDLFFLMSFFYLFISFDKQEIKYDKEIGIQDIFRKIMTCDKFYQSKKFNIEVDSHNFLVESDIAQVALSLFEIKHNKIYSDFIVILSAFLLPFVDSPLDRLKKFNCITKNDSFYYYDSIALIFQKNLLTKEDPQKIEANRAKYELNFVSKFEQFFSPLDTNVFLKNLQMNLKLIDHNFKVFLNDKFNNMSTQLFKSYVNQFEMMKTSFKNQWESFWYSNSKPKDSIFHYSIQTDNVHFKRDNTNCFFNCPFKLVKNTKFNDHLKESLFRDLGNKEKAEKQYNQIKSEEEKKVEENNFFKINLNKENEKKKIFELNNNNENIIYQTNECERRKPDKSYFVTFIIFINRLQIGDKFISFEEIKSIFLRYVQQNQTAIEIFLLNGNSYFLNFPNILNSFTVVSKIEQAVKIDHPNLKTIFFQTTCSNKFLFENQKFTQKWQNGEMSNFEYLMKLNIYCGRTFNDAKFYPVMPWIIQDYDLNELNLNDPKIFRDLSLPIGAVNEKRFDMLFNSFKASKNPETLFLYSSWLICPLSLFVWLVRLEPFATNHTIIQGGKFDVEQRIFHSIKAAYYLCTHDNNDFRELIPEFFFQSEFLLNINKFDLGEKMKENDKSDVELPNWAKNPFEFIYKHRKALESEFVSRKLNKWIDLIFGCHQKSEEFKNIYRAELYSDVWESELGKNSLNKDRICCSLDLLGQIPHPLFDEPHPEKQILTKNELLKKWEDKWPSKEFKLSIEKDFELVDLRKKKSIEIGRNYIIHSILNKKNDLVNESVNYFLNLYCLQFVFLDSNHKKMTAFTHFLKYEIKPNSIDLISSSLLFVESVDSESDCLSIASDCIKNVSNFGFLTTADSYIYLSMNLLSNDLGNQKKFAVKNEIGINFEKVAVSGLYLAALNSDSNTLHVFGVKNESDSFVVHLNDYLVDEDSINCVAISDIFHLCVCGTKNSSSLIFVSLNKKDVERIVSIENEIPIKISITSSWGFIIVLTQDKTNANCRLHLFNVNGYFIAKSEVFKIDTSIEFKPLISSNVKSENSIENLIDFNMNKIFCCRQKDAPKFVCWKSFDGFDFVLMADLHSVYNFEAFDVSKAPGKPIFTFKNEIIGIDFIEETMKVVVTLDDGRVVVSNVFKK